MAQVDIAKPPQEYPDIVGARPTNPLAAAFRPYVPANISMPELSWPHLLIGTALGILFGASSLYLVLKVGLTVSASIPVAVLSITIFRVFSKLGFKDANILQNNIVQAAGSAGESAGWSIDICVSNSVTKIYPTSNLWLKATKAPAFYLRPGTSPEQRSPASSSHSSPVR
jgi:hypothetical protein